MPVLLIASAGPNYQEDLVHEGLEELLGGGGLRCYPYKEHARFSINLHLDGSAACACPPLSEEELVERAGEIAAVVVGSIRHDAVGVWRRLQGFFPDRPIAWLHGEDDRLPWPDGVVATHRFLREMLPDDEGVFPLQFGVPTHAMVQRDCPRDIDLSFVARTNNAWRRQEVAARLGEEGFLVRLDAPISRREYCEVLSRSKICVAVRGLGYDTMRYWEVPYQGALLLSERHPLVIPDDFVDGESAVFFASLDDMIAKARALLADPTRLAAIAARGRTLARAKHTALARARYLLGTLGLDPDPAPDREAV